MSALENDRARIRALASVAFDAIPGVWPIGGFIATNPLAGFEHLPFRDAIATMRERTGARGYLPEAEYLKRYRAGRISPTALERALERVAPGLASECRTLWGRSIGASEIARCVLLADRMHRSDRSVFDAEFELRLRSIGPIREADSFVSYGELIDAVCGTKIVDTIDDRMMLWCAAFLDEGQAAWSMPGREAGFYGAWRRLVRYDSSDAARTIDRYRERVLRLEHRAEDLLRTSLQALGIDHDAWAAYLESHVLQLPGWAGIIKWRAAHPNDPSQRAMPVDPVAYLAIRVWYEAALVESVAERYGIAPTKDAFVDRFGAPPARTIAAGRTEVLAAIAGGLAIAPSLIRALGDDDLRWLLEVAFALDEERRSLIWLEASEIEARSAILRSIVERPRAQAATPPADVVFCIDVRSEGLRRHLESVGPYRTRGFAGFFGLPIALRSIDSAVSQQACPVLVTPKHRVDELASGESFHLAIRRRRRRAFGAALSGLVDEIKAGVASPFALFEAIGALFIVPLVARTLFPGVLGRVRASLARVLAPTVPTTFTLEKTADREPEVGFTPAERLFFAESALSLMGMRADFARLVVLVGHGSTSENNPFEASLDCGACAGNPGGPSARILAQLLNREDVRTGLVARGISLPRSTVFVAGEHDTARDRIRVLDEHLVPPSHRSDLANFERDAEIAGARLSAERVRALAVGATGVRHPARHVERRSSDWAQIRPEWGLARNAAFVIAPRSFTAGADLGNRAFLHEYDVERDLDGALLEIVMTGPLVVAQWINNHYYFAAVDNERYGSGTKVIHNVVSGIGVMSGNRGDLRAGLPLQSLADGAGLYHEPLRLLTIVTAPRARVAAIVGRNVILQKLFHNEWIALAVWDPGTETFWDYRADGSWCERDRQPELAKERS